jgi:hypothetical protein
MDVNYRAQKDDKANPLYPVFLAILFFTENIGGGDGNDRKYMQNQNYRKNIFY